MTDDTPTAATVPATENAPPPVDRRSPLLVALAILALIVVVGGIALWRQGAAAADQVAAMQAKLDAADSRLARLEARPAAQDPRPLEQRLTALEARQSTDLRPVEQRVAALEARPTPDLHPLEQHVAALEARPAPDLGPLDQRIAALEHKPVPEATLDAASQKQLAALSGRIDGIAARQDQLGTQAQADAARMREQLAATDQKAAAAAGAVSAAAARADKAGSDVAALTQSEAKIARLQEAAVALGTGRPLGTIPGAPPALARFATTAPPTEAALRLSFAAAADKALEAGQPARDGTPFWSRVWSRAQSGLVVRQGDRVLVGDVVTGILEHARHQLDAGDLAGAVTVLDGLAGPAAAAMAPWRAQAQSLLDARAALLTVAHG